MTFEQALSTCGPDQRITYGTRTLAWHVIGNDDRDYDTPFSLSCEQARAMGEARALESSIGPFMIGTGFGSFPKPSTGEKS